MEHVKNVLVLGAGALKIGQAGEFDYSGSQALKALREERIRTILVNPNIATIQTSKALADQLYFLPVTPFFVEKIIERERPDGILLSFGGQTALNCGIELSQQGVLERYGVRILGTPISAIILTEDREKFARHLRALSIPTPHSRIAGNLSDALQIAAGLDFPLMVRAGYALGGQGSGVAHNTQELSKIVSSALAFAPQVLIEQYLHHYKEVEYEVLRDATDNCITVCNMENMDPLGIHTGESVVIAPTQTLTNAEYHTLRSASISIVRSLGIVGECNVQFALDPATSQYYVIEVNARLSRSSALASKATGYPLAYVAAKLALGYTLTELTNWMTGITKACFEPSLDYVVVKIPRWDLEKFKGVDHTIGTSMKSVGEVMGIGRTFEEAYQKAIRMLDLDLEGATSEKVFATDTVGVISEYDEATIIDKYLYSPTPRRLFALPLAMRCGFSIAEIHQITGIDPWFLSRIKHIVECEQELRDAILSETRHPSGVSLRGTSPSSRDEEVPSARDDEVLSADRLLALKQIGLSDKRIGELVGKTGLAIRALRQHLGVIPSVLQIDTLAGEFPSDTNYLYLTYNASHHDVEPLYNRSVVVLGSGPYRIGSSVEFDWTSVSTVDGLKRHGKQAIVINCNPETVSTDYDTSDRLYFEELSFERIADICEFEQPQGVIVSVGGQTPNNRVKALDSYGINVLGTSATNIDLAENRYTFSHLLDTLGIKQPEWATFSRFDELPTFAHRVGYPVLVRPSYVLSGSAMKVCYDDEQLLLYTSAAVAVSPGHPVTVSKFFEQAREIEMDAVARYGELKAFVISEHVENAGVHSGDATIVLPPQTISQQAIRDIEEMTRAIAAALDISGPFNIQFLVKENQVYVIEANLRASRTFPFISKVTGVNLIDLFVDELFRDDLPPVHVPRPNFVAVKAPQFSFSRLTGADPILRVEMASTGEVACFGEDIEEAYLKAVLSTGHYIPRKGIFISLGGDDKKLKFLPSAYQLSKLGIPLYATEKTAAFLHANGVEATILYKLHEHREPNILTAFHNDKIDLAINIVDRHIMKEIDDDYAMRRCAVDHSIPLFTKVKQARLFIKALTEKSLATIPIKAWDEYTFSPLAASGPPPQ